MPSPSSIRIILIVLLVAVLLPWLLNNFVEPGKAVHPRSYLDAFQRPVILCHRGSRYMGPENSIHMHRQALAMGCDVLEFDVRLTKDNQLVIHHDPNVDRTANMKGDVKDFTYTQLQLVDSAYQYTPKGKGQAPYSDQDFPFRGKGFHIPLLRAFLDAFDDNYKNIEIKDNVPLAAELLWQELQKRPQTLPKTIVASGHCDVLRHFRHISNGAVATSGCEKEALAFFVTYKLGIGKFWFWLFPPVEVAYQAPVVSGGVWLNDSMYVHAAHAQNQKLMYWVINSESLAHELLDLGADGLVSDRTDLIYNAFYQRRFVRQSLEDRLKDMPVNTSDAFFIPASNPQEVHTCVSLGCKILPLFIDHHFFILGLILGALLFGIYATFDSKPIAPVSTPSSSQSNQSKKKKKTD